MAGFLQSWCIIFMAVTAVCMIPVAAMRDWRRLIILAMFLVGMPASYVIARTIEHGPMATFFIWSFVTAYIIQRLKIEAPAIFAVLGLGAMAAYNLIPVDAPALMMVSDALFAGAILTLAGPACGGLVGMALDWLGRRARSVHLVHDMASRETRGDAP